MFFIARLILRFIILNPVRFFYRLRRICGYKVPKYGGALVLPNHISYIDSFIMDFSCPRKMRFLTLDKYVANPLLGWFLVVFRTIPIDRSKARDAIDKVSEALKNEDLVCIYPEGGMTRSGLLNELKRGPELMARRADKPVIPTYIDGVWGSIFSYEGGRFFKKWPKQMFRPTQVAFGDPIEAEDATTERIFEGMLAASVDAVAARRCFEKNLETAVISSLKKGRGKEFSYEYGKEARRWSRAKFLGIAMGIARRWINNAPDSRERIGILLPPGPIPAVINLGLFLAGKTPVTLPFNLSAEQVEMLAQEMEELGIRTVITSNAFMPHLIDFWRGDEGRFIDIKNEISGASSFMLSQEHFFSKIEPAWLTTWRIDLQERDKHREAIGFIEEPGKPAVFLTSHELHRNAIQVISGDHIRKGDSIFSETPMNTIVGQMMNLWVPILNQGRSLCRSYSKRTDAKLLKAIVEGQQANVIVGDQDFYQSIDEDQNLNLPHLRFAMVFDKELDWNLLGELEKSLELDFAPGWCFAGRIVTLSLNSEVEPPEGSIELMDRKSGSVGRFLPGIAGRRKDDRFYIRFDSTMVSKQDFIKGNKISEANEIWLEVGEGAYLDKQGFFFVNS